MLTRIALCLSFLFSPAVVSAQQVMECDWQASARSIPEPWEAHTRTFSNGTVRLAMLDTIEPAGGWAYLMILSPPFDELGSRQCKLIGTGDMGFSGMTFSALTADYDPAQGLIFTLPVQFYQYGDLQMVEKTLRITLNQSSGQIDTWVLDR
ncbi:hypothetical protein ACN2XU_00815 [Primorskyibacter sp. 2E107]|uniref:hypothetical protein n=1 Tax=Primorskyibacter sp. 2E107 TaxID=3403458 RepID=UPI003AF9CD18